MSAALYIVSAPSGCGKTSLVRRLVESMPNLVISISYTTRRPRSDEKEGIAYRFIDEKTFTHLVNQDFFLEHANVFDHYYGTSTQEVKEKLASDIDVILEIDWQGARQIKQKMKEAISIFILPPNWQTLIERLHERGQDEASIITKRMNKAKEEISHYDEYDYLVINKDFDCALRDLQSIVRARRLRLANQKIACSYLLEQLL